LICELLKSNFTGNFLSLAVVYQIHDMQHHNIIHRWQQETPQAIFVLCVQDFCDGAPGP